MWTTITLEVLVTPWGLDSHRCRNRSSRASVLHKTHDLHGLRKETFFFFFVSGCERRPQGRGPTASPAWADRTLHQQ